MDFVRESLFDSSGSQFAVHEGFWKDFDRPLADQNVLTLRDSHASIIKQSLAVVIFIAGAASWKLFRVPLYSIFQSFRTEPRGSSLGHEIQVSIRNSESAWGLLLTLSTLIAGQRLAIWQSRNFRLWLSLFIIILFTFLHAIIFPLCGILVTFVDIGTVVRSMHTSTCGAWFISESALSGSENMGSWERSVAAFPQFQFILNSSLAAENYVSNCYYGEGVVPFECSLLPTRFLEFTEDMEDCPFQNGLCTTPDKKAFSMESQNISFHQLGINTPYARDISIQRRAVCSTISMQPFVYDYARKEAELKAHGSNYEADEVVIYSFFPGRNGVNMTRMYPTDEWAICDLETYMVSGQGDVFPFGSTNTSDISFMFLRSFALTAEPVNDPWFNSTLYIPPNGYTMYQYMSVLVCKESVRYCSSLTDDCTPWKSMMEVVTSVPELFPKGVPGRAISEIFLPLISLILMDNQFHFTISYRNCASLRASRFLNYSKQMRLDEEQWKIELRHWFFVSLAKLQLAVFSLTQAPQDLDQQSLENLIDKIFAHDSEDRSTLCEGFKLYSSHHKSLSVLGLLIVISVTGVLFLAGCVFWLVPEDLLKRKFPVLENWAQDEVLEVLKEVKASNQELEDDGESSSSSTSQVVQLGSNSMASHRGVYAPVSSSHST